MIIDKFDFKKAACQKSIHFWVLLGTELICISYCSRDATADTVRSTYHLAHYLPNTRHRPISNGLKTQKTVNLGSVKFRILIHKKSYFLYSASFMKKTQTNIKYIVLYCIVLYCFGSYPVQSLLNFLVSIIRHRIIIQIHILYQSRFLWYTSGYNKSTESYGGSLFSSHKSM